MSEGEKDKNRREREGAHQFSKWSNIDASADAFKGGILPRKNKKKFNSPSLTASKIYVASLKRGIKNGERENTDWMAP